MTGAERRLVDVAVAWWHANRFRNPPVRPDSPLWDYYQQPDVAALVMASADVAAERLADAFDSEGTKS